ncbi:MULTISPECIES: hypothetical protein [unclassified Streptomyces]|uniref:hypothetical protein n=1 Tax=unclassified Streptomyces TaxID=2593676 RepID=UPI0033270E72
MSFVDLLMSVTGCRLHGGGCTVPWGYDRDHTDSSSPYTIDELAGRHVPPHRYAYPTAAAYEQGFCLWRALYRDHEPTYLERLVATATNLAPLSHPGGKADHGESCQVATGLDGLEGAPLGFAQAVAALCHCQDRPETAQ